MKKTWTEVINGKEMKVVHGQWHRIEKEVLDAKVRRIAGDHIRVYEMPRKSVLSMDDPIRMGVNWAACGTVYADEAVDFAEKLTEVSKMASEYKYNGYVEKFSSWYDLTPEEQEEIKAYARENGLM